MNIKNRLQKITIILATFLILFNFMGGNVFGYGGQDSVKTNENSSTPNASNTRTLTANEYIIQETSTNQGTHKDMIIKKIKESCNVDDETANDVLAVYQNDSSKISITQEYGYVGGSLDWKAPTITINVTEDDITEAVNSNPEHINVSNDFSAMGIGNLWDPEAEGSLGLESLLIVPTVGLVVTAVDGIYKVFQNFILGTNTSAWNTVASALPWAGNHIVIDKNKGQSQGLISDGSTLTEDEKNAAVPIQFSQIYHIPTMILTPAAIFEGKVAALNGNFFDTDDVNNEIGGENMSTVTQLKSTVSGWYITLRNIAVVGLLSVLIYIGIRIIISTSNSDKAKYKQFFMDWVIALCLIFFMHYIMSFIMTVTDSVIAMMASDQGEDGSYQAKEVLVQFENANDGNETERYMYTSFAGVARMRLQYDSTATKLGYTVMYIAFVGYTVYFSVIYLKRILYLSFFTMIAPLVALTYPLDKIKDGKAQAFNFWFKEYIFYAMLQPLHLFLYTVLIKSAMALASKNMIYAIVAMAFIVPAEKIVKSMFGIRGQTEGNLGGLMGLSAATHMFQLLRKPPKMPQGGGAGKGADGDAEGITDSPDKGKFDKLFNMPMSMSNGGNDPTASANTGLDDSAVSYNDQQQLEISAQKRAQLQAEAEAEQQRKAAEEEARNQRAAAAGQTQNSAIPDGSTAGINTVEQPQLSRRRQLTNNFKTAYNKRLVAAGGYKGIATRAAKGVGKGLVKGYTTAAGAVGLGAVGLGLGMVGGDLNNAWQGLAAGAGVGAYIGNNAGNGMLNTASATLGGRNALGAFASEVWNGEDESIRLREEKDYMNNKDNISRIQAEHGDWNYKQIQEHAKREYNMQRDSGIHDVKLANKAIELEDKLGGGEANHKHVAQILEGTKHYSEATFRSTKKLNEARDAVIESSIEGGVSREDAIRSANKVFSELGSLYGRNNIPPKRIEQKQQKTQQENQNNTSSRTQQELGDVRGAKTTTKIRRTSNKNGK